MEPYDFLKEQLDRLSDEAMAHAHQIVQEHLRERAYHGLFDTVLALAQNHYERSGQEAYPGTMINVGSGLVIIEPKDSEVGVSYFSVDRAGRGSLEPVVLQKKNISIILSDKRMKTEPFKIVH